MDILKEISERRSIRKYKSKAVEEKDLLQLIEAARLAPSGNNLQPWRFMIIKDQELKNKIIAVDHQQKWMETAPVFIACIADLRCRSNKDGETFAINRDLTDDNFRRIVRDTSIGITCLLLQAQHLGLGTCWTGWYDQNQMQQMLNLPAYYYVVGIVTLGYPDEEPAMRPRYAIEELIINSREVE